MFWDNIHKSTHFIKQPNGNLKSYVLQNGLYCTEIKKQFVPLLPQQDDDHLFVLKRYYATLQRDSNYKKKRISWFEKMPGFSCEVQTKAIAEYLGTFKAYQMNKRGNAKITKQ